MSKINRNLFGFFEIFLYSLLINTEDKCLRINIYKIVLNRQMLAVYKEKRKIKFEERSNRILIDDLATLWSGPL
jgi:hypothetical protein